MADLQKQDNRESWLTWAIAFMRRGLWLDQEITVHGPHESTNKMWGNATARTDGKECVDCSFTAIAKGSKYRPGRIKIWNTDDKEEDKFPLLKASKLTPKAKKWLRAAHSTLRQLRSMRGIEKGR